MTGGTRTSILIRAYGSLLMVFASKTTSRDNRKLPKCRFSIGISHPGSFLQGHFVRAPLQDVRPLEDWSPGGGGRDQSQRDAGNIIGTPAQIGWSSNIGSTFPMQHSYPPHSTALPVAAVGGGGNRLQRHIRNAMRPLLRWQCCDHR